MHHAADPLQQSPHSLFPSLFYTDEGLVEQNKRLQLKEVPFMIWKFAMWFKSFFLKKKTRKIVE